MTDGARLIYAILNLVIDTAATVLASLLLFRFWMQAVRVRPPLSMGQFIFKMTDWLVLPLRRLMPGVGGYDWASLVGTLLVALGSMALQLGMRSAFAPEPWLLLSLLSMVHWVAYGFIGLIIIEVIFSWVNPNAPLAPLVRGMTEPLLSPFRRVLPAIAGVDLSPVLAFLALRILVFVAETLVYSAY